SFSANHTPTTAIYTLSLHVALPISANRAHAAVPVTAHQIAEQAQREAEQTLAHQLGDTKAKLSGAQAAEEKYISDEIARRTAARSEEHTSELQSLAYLVCRLLLEKK